MNDPRTNPLMEADAIEVESTTPNLSECKGREICVDRELLTLAVLIWQCHV